MDKSNKEIAVILAAGRGSRLKELSLEQPKPMVSVCNQTIIGNLVKLLIKAGIKEIVVMVGYQAEKLKHHLKPFSIEVSITFVENDIYDKTNNIYTLWLARNYLKNGFYLFEADVFLEQSIMDDFMAANKENVMLVDKFSSLMNGTVVSFNQDKKVLGMFLKSDQTEGFNFEDKFKTVNFYKISKQFAETYFIPRLDYYIEQKTTGSYYELIIKEAIDNGVIFFAQETGNSKWFEIDTREDLEIAERMFGHSN